jgi:hypothetical protein
MRTKFGRELREGTINFNFNFDTEFQVESYLRHQGHAFVDRFDANTYLLITKTLDYFDPAADFDQDLSVAFHRAQARFSSDLLHQRLAVCAGPLARDRAGAGAGRTRDQLCSKFPRNSATTLF